MVHLCWIAAFLLPFFVALPSMCHADCNCGYGDGRFTTHSGIVIDGSMSDWSSVLSDLDNNSCDAYGPLDRDHIVQSTGRDLLHFAYTWNNNYVQTFTARQASASNVQQFIYYADSNNNGFMETGERVIVVTWKGANRLVEVRLGFYAQVVSGGGDSMVDGNGYADGYMLPGGVTGLPPSGQPDYSGNWGSSDGLSMEWQVPWGVIGIDPGSAFTFHVSSTNSNPGAASFPDQVDDNMGGCGGGAASTQYAGLTFTPDRAITGQSGTVYAAHVLTNDGNGDDTFNFASIVSEGFVPSEILYYRDVDDSGTYTNVDVLLGDTDNDLSIDSGPLSAGETLNILIAYTISTGLTGMAKIVTTAMSSYDNNIHAFVTDTITLLPDIIIMKTVSTESDPVNNVSADAKAIPGAIMKYTIIVTNTGSGAVDANTVTIFDPIPANTSFYIGTNGAISPVTFTDTGSGLTYTFSGLSNDTDDLDFEGSSGYGYHPPQPTADPLTWFDDNIKSIRINPKGVFNPSNGVPDPSFQIEFKVRVR